MSFPYEKLIFPNFFINRSYCLDVLHDSLIHCCGCSSADKLPPGLTYAELYSVDASFGRQFSARAEKAQLDSRTRRQHYSQQLITEDEDEDEDEEEGGIEAEEENEEEQQGYQQSGLMSSQKEQPSPNRDARGDLLSSIRAREPFGTTDRGDSSREVDSHK